MNFKIDQNGVGILTLTNELTIESARELKEQFCKVFKLTEHLIVDTDKVLKFDLACLQIFWAAYHYSIKHNKQFFLQDKTGIVKASFKRAGFTYGNNKL